MKPAVLIASLLLCLSGWCQSQQPQQLRFEKYDFHLGLSNPVISHIYQDKAGFLWIATNFGLNRYDGKRFENYYHQQNQPNSLVNNAVLNLSEDKNGILWIGTNEGISA